MSVVKQLKKITPTFQAVLTKEIGQAMDAINEGRLEKAFSILKTLICALRKEDSNPLLENDVVHIEALLGGARKPSSISFYRGLLETSANQEVVLLENVRNLFLKVMRVLHEGGYLEIRAPKIPTGIAKEMQLR